MTRSLLFILKCTLRSSKKIKLRRNIVKSSFMLSSFTTFLHIFLPLYFCFWHDFKLLHTLLCHLLFKHLTSLFWGSHQLEQLWIAQFPFPLGPFIFFLIYLCCNLIFIISNIIALYWSPFLYSYTRSALLHSWSYLLCDHTHFLSTLFPGHSIYFYVSSNVAKSHKHITK